MITIDDRERKSGICGELEKLQLPFEIKRLEIGDYIINETIFIERKTTRDFIESMKDRRLLNQAAKLRKGGRRAIMIIEGSRLAGNASIRGALCSISVKCYMPVLRSADLTGTALIIKHLHSYNNDEYYELPYCTHDLRAKRCIVSMQERMLMQMRQIGPDLATKLVEKFGTIDRIINASDSELMKIKGIGQQMVQQIRLLR